MIVVGQHEAVGIETTAVGLFHGGHEQLAGLAEVIAEEVISCQLALHVVLHGQMARGSGQLTGLLEADDAAVGAIVGGAQHVAHVAQVVDEAQGVGSALVDGVGLTIALHGAVEHPLREVERAHLAVHQGQQTVGGGPLCRLLQPL